ncbi:MAG: cytochrome c oxidase subunit II [Armatimonadota bacterium]|nr:cytochrome c oxidase subunit II [Armatimonadota bacterium]MDR7421450.1 cytochrome c oxidase subunit II [Armatimonadota bacterium]MDR7453042.1 cytochrome c oxidase subunit II [Armatimonadota bacterium]MDR7497200.1 cytochrome c oxidase subunit II [Armatimonadota bacterium]MDR7513044.1 cytochrome c oxidase subunit II [Armatimonadota bacterium]
MANAPQHSDARGTGLAVALLIVGLVVVGGVGATLYATGRWWLPPVASAHGVAIDRLFYSTLVITGVVFIGVHVLLALFVWRFAARGAGRAVYFHDHRRLELTYTIIPAIALAIMVAMSGIVWARVRLGAPPADALVVDVRGEQFAWLARYPGPDGRFGRVDPRRIDARTNPMGLDPEDPAARDDVVSRTLHLVVGRPVRVQLRSTGVLHSFFVPEFRVKQDTVPGMTIEIWFTPTREGQFEIACAELCGIGHYAMRGQVVVQSPEAFAAWLAQQRPALAPAP